MRDPLTIEAGTLRHTVQIEAQTSVQNDFGEPINTWTTVATLRVAIRSLTLSERYSVSGFEGQATHRITLRYISTPLASGMRIVYGSRTFTLQAVENVLERNRVLTLLAQELNPTQ